MGRPLNNLRLPQLIEKLLNILRLSLLRESTERLLYSITDEITIRSTAIFSKTMEDLTVTDSDLDMTLDYIAEDFTDAETILDDMKSALGTTIPYFINSVKRSIFLSGAPPEVHEILQEIWYRSIGKGLSNVWETTEQWKLDMVRDFWKAEKSNMLRRFHYHQ